MAKIDNNFINNIIDEIKNKRGTPGKSILNRIKFGMPEWIRNIVFSRLNPFYVYYIFSKIKKEQEEEFPVKYINFSIDFVMYCLNNNVSIDLDLYYPPKDQKVITRYVRNRVKSCFNVKLLYNELCEDSDLKGKIKRSEKEVFTRSSNGNFEWLTGNRKYVVPEIPEPSCFYYLQGIPQLPQPVLERIKQKLFLSIGALWGDTAISMIQFEPEKILCFEPEKNNYDSLVKVVEYNKLQEIIQPVKYGAGSKNEVQYIEPGEGNSQISNLGNEKIEIRTIDSFMEDYDPEVGLIKMDIEGWEYQALVGAEKTIKQFQPVLIICVYHSGLDFFEIPPLLKSYNPDYQFRFLNLAPFNINEKVLVAYNI